MVRVNSYSAGPSHYAYSLTLSRTCYFATLNPETHQGGGGIPSPRGRKIGNRSSQKRGTESLDVLNRTMPDMASLCQILIFPAQVKQKMLFSDFLVTSTSLQKKVWNKNGKKCFTLPCLLYRETSKLIHADPDELVWNFYLSACQIKWSDARIQEDSDMHISCRVMTK